MFVFVQILSEDRGSIIYSHKIIKKKKLFFQISDLNWPYLLFNKFAKWSLLLDPVTFLSHSNRDYFKVHQLFNRVSHYNTNTMTSTYRNPILSLIKTSIFGISMHRSLLNNHSFKTSIFGITLPRNLLNNNSFKSSIFGISMPRNLLNNTRFKTKQQLQDQYLQSQYTQEFAQLHQRQDQYLWIQHQAL